MRNIIKIKISDLDDYKAHPFKVTDDEKMLELEESIKELGVLMSLDC